MGFRVLVLIVTRWAYAGIYNFVSRSYHCNTKLIQVASDFARSKPPVTCCFF
jgi:hypothetical protein